MEGVWVHWVGVRWHRDRVILVVREFIWNAFVVLLVLSTFDDTGSLGYPSRRVVYRPSVSTLVTASHVLAGNMEAELKSATFSSLLLFNVFLSSLFSFSAPAKCTSILILHQSYPHFFFLLCSFCSYISTRVSPALQSPLNSLLSVFYCQSNLFFFHHSPLHQFFNLCYIYS